MADENIGPMMASCTTGRGRQIGVGVVVVGVVWTIGGRGS